MIKLGGRIWIKVFVALLVLDAFVAIVGTAAFGTGDLISVLIFGLAAGAAIVFAAGQFPSFLQSLHTQKRALRRQFPDLRQWEMAFHMVPTVLWDGLFVLGPLMIAGVLAFQLALCGMRLFRS